MADFFGDSGDNLLVGTTDPDTFDISTGGADTVQASDGADIISAGAALSADDQIDGGAGSDTLFIEGDYSAGLVFTDTTMTNVEHLVLTAGHSYDLTFAAGTGIAGGTVNVEGNLQAGDFEHIDGSAFATGENLKVVGGSGRTFVIGGAGDDQVVSNQTTDRVSFAGGDGNDSLGIGFRLMTAADHFDGGAGSDTLQLNFAGDYHFNGGTLKNVETMFLLFTDDSSMTMNNGNLANGQELSVSVLSMSTGQTMVFEASSERNGDYSFDGGDENDNVSTGGGADTILGVGGDDQLSGGGGADSLSGGAGNDTIAGGTGGDVLSGGIGDDTFIYTDLSDSGHHKAFDLIIDLEATDVIDLSAIDARSDKAGDQAFHQIDAFTGHAGELVLSYDADADLTSLEVDVNGDGKADMTVHMTGDQSGFAGLVL